MSKKLTSRKGSWSKKIIETREKSGKWHKAMLEGRIEARANPSNIQRLRSLRKWRQADLAKLLGIAIPTFTAIERGKRPVKRDVAFKIAKQLGVKVVKIFQPQGKKFVAVIQRQEF